MWALLAGVLEATAVLLGVTPDFFEQEEGRIVAGDFGRMRKAVWRGRSVSGAFSCAFR